MELRDAAPGDYPEILRLNRQALPHVNDISPQMLEELAGQSLLMPVVRVAGRLAGFVIVLDETARYGSPNFQYFRRCYPSFAYVDRIVVADPFRRQGLSSALYGHVARGCAGCKPVLTCEVNLQPPNPGSLAFHEAAGFRAVGVQDTEGGAKTVQLMAKTLPWAA